MTNKLELTDILEVVKEKYKDSIIDENFISKEKIIILQDIKSKDLSQRFYLEFEDNLIKYKCNSWHLKEGKVNWSEKECLAIFDNNIIELKHQLKIDIKWEDLVEYANTEEIGFAYDEKSKSLEGYGIEITNRDELKLWLGVDRECACYYNRSYWQMYQIIKNLTENEVKNDLQNKI